MAYKILILLYFNSSISIRTKADTNIKFFPQSNRRRAIGTNKICCPTHFFAALNELGSLEADRPVK